MRVDLVRMSDAAENAAQAVCMEGAISYRNLLYTAIASQQFPVSYEPYNKWYAKKKMDEVGHLRFWEYWGDLMQSLGVFQEGDDWLAGVHPDAVNQKGENIHEYGTRNEAKRPLFGPVADQYAQDQWKRLCKRMLDSITMHWN